MKRVIFNLPAQPGAEYPNGGTEGYWIGKIADRAIQLLSAGGEVEAARVSPEDSRQPGSPGECGLYISLRSQTAPPEAAGQRKGLDVCYAEHSADGKLAAEKFAARLKEAYPQPELAGPRPVAEAETTPMTDVPVLLIKLAYHDNPQDEAWLTNGTEEIAEKLLQAIQEVLEVPAERPEADHA